MKKHLSKTKQILAYALRSSVTFAALIILLSRTLSASEKIPNRWHLDEDLVAEVSYDAGMLTFQVTNEGHKTRTINSSLADEHYIAANVVRVSCHVPGDPRERVQTFRMAGDGEIGMTSELFIIKMIDLKPGQSVKSKLSLADALNQVAKSSKALLNWQKEGDRLICIRLAISFRDIGIDSYAGVELVCPWLPVNSLDPKMPY